MVYAYKNEDRELMRSSSGGAFLALCRAFAKREEGARACYYCGAVMTEDLHVAHRIVDSVEKCAALQGSKYVKSELGTCYPTIRTLLRDGNAVLFSGTPCQVAGLKRYLAQYGEPAEHLLTIDVICHGAPVKRVWDDYKRWLEQQAKSALTSYSFRYKPEGWRAYPARAVFQNGKEYVNTSETSVYSRLQMRGLSVSSGCFSCAYAKEQREGDVTLGDFWGIETIAPDIPHKNGVSLVLTNTERGEQLMALLSQNTGRAQLVRQIPGNTYLNYQHNLRAPTEKPADYEAFWQEYARGFDYVLRKYLRYGSRYQMLFRLKKIIRKTPVIDVYRRLRRRQTG
ncbi:MAG TPA: Coenzyme F420 hydrogenase/dehydrogenase, beta subunit C-terminal domain [Candidatus Butyricicoccus stercorigallinarum]|nr:Coenzyme F420 hydrogenase/dehydrogenase, beta subunit C-terminal domain [Candidatus Butyricicoccus stercorigallinarum]